MSTASDFIIENGILKEYTGSDEVVVIPEGVTEIGGSAFKYQHKLTKIAFPESLKTNGSEAFACCRGLTSVVVPKSVKMIGEEAFWRVDFEELTLLGKPKIG